MVNAAHDSWTDGIVSVCSDGQYVRHWVKAESGCIAYFASCHYWHLLELISCNVSSICQTKMEAWILRISVLGGEDVSFFKGVVMRWKHLWKIYELALQIQSLIFMLLDFPGNILQLLFNDVRLSKYCSQVVFRYNPQLKSWICFWGCKGSKVFEKAVASSSIFKGGLAFIEGSDLISLHNLHITSSFLVHLAGGLWVTGVPKGMWYGHLLTGVSSFGFSWGVRAAIVLCFGLVPAVVFLALIKITLGDDYICLHCYNVSLYESVLLHVCTFIYAVIVHSNRSHTWCLLAMLISLHWMY